MTKVAFGFNTDFQRQLYQSWSSADTKLIKQAFLSGAVAPNAQQHVTDAFRSARKVPKSMTGRRLKQRFLDRQYRWIFKYLKQQQPEQVLIYNGLNGVNYLANMASQELGLKCLFFERAPLQDRVQIDPNGVNFNSSVPRDVDFYKQLPVDELPNYQPPSYIDARISAQQNTKTPSQGVEHSSPRYVFCPLQVPRDTQITVFGGWIQSIQHLLDCVNVASTALPSSWYLKIKEHPSSPQSFAERIASYENPRLVLDNETDVYQSLQNSAGVLTINSSVGLEAFTLDKLVVTLGNALYSFGDLTTQALSVGELSDAFQNIEDLRWSIDHRMLLLRFLNFWYPKTERVLEGLYGMNDLAERDHQFESWLGFRNSA